MCAIAGDYKEASVAMRDGLLSHYPDDSEGWEKYYEYQVEWV